VFGPKILEDIDVAGVDALGESAITLKARIKTLPLEQWNVRRAFLRRIKQAFDERGIEIPFPHLTVYSRSAPAKDAGAARSGGSATA
jgi:small conductance mechanosensitive channel